MHTWAIFYSLYNLLITETSIKNIKITTVPPFFNLSILNVCWLSRLERWEITALKLPAASQCLISLVFLSYNLSSSRFVFVLFEVLKLLFPDLKTLPCFHWLCSWEPLCTDRSICWSPTKDDLCLLHCLLHSWQEMSQRKIILNFY